MATIKTIEYHCPHCGKKLRTTPYNDYCSINSTMYGNPWEACPKCGKTYRNSNLTEPATGLTFAQNIPFLASSVRLIVAESIAAAIIFALAVTAEAFEILLLLIFVAAFHVAVSAVTWSYRRKHKDKLLADSRHRLKDTEYFVRFLLSSLSQADRNRLTPQNVALMHAYAISLMDADKVLDVGSVVRSVL